MTYKNVRLKHVRYDDPSKIIMIDTGISGYEYEVDLERCKTAAACLDWIHQLHTKTWYDAEREKEFIDILFDNIPDDMWSGQA